MLNAKQLFFLIALLSGYAANAGGPKHMFWCGVLTAEPMRQVYFTMEDKDASSGNGTIKISKLSHHASLNSGWLVQEEAQVKAQITWGSHNGKPVITGINIDMGRSGRVVAKTTEAYDRYSSAKGFIQANLFSLNAPTGVEASCSYNIGLPKPGMTGSN